MENLLVVGGTGFIGRHIVLMAKDKYNVYSLSKQVTKSNQYIPGVRYMIADLQKPSQIKKVLNDLKINYVVNCGGYVDHSNFFENGLDIIQTHFIGLMNLISSLNMDDIKGFVQISSGDTYGTNPWCTYLNENQKEKPASCYSFAKTASDYFVQMMYRENEMPIASVRIFLTYGEDQGKERFIPQIMEGCFSDSTFPVSEGEQLRDFCHVDDLAKGILDILVCEAAYGRVINLGSGISTKIKDMVKFIKTSVGKGNPQFGKIPYRKNEIMRILPDTSLARTLINWNPSINVNDRIISSIIEKQSRNR